MTDPAAPLLFVTEPQQLDAVHEYGTETLSPDSIRVIPDACTSCEERPAVAGVELCPACALAAGHGPCDYCDAYGPCDEGCGCPSCENDRALDEDADRYEEV